MSSELDFGQL